MPFVFTARHGKDFQCILCEQRCNDVVKPVGRDVVVCLDCVRSMMWVLADVAEAMLRFVPQHIQGIDWPTEEQ